MKKILLTIFSLGIVLLFASCDNANNSVNYDEEYKFDHHVHEIDESKTVHYNANCLHEEFDEYFCECGKRYGYSNSREYDSGFKGTNINHTFVNGVCTKCGCEESPFEIELISPTTCRIVYFTMEENDDVVIPDQIYGLDVVEVSIKDEYYANGKFKIVKKLNSFTIGKNIKKMNIVFRYFEWLENVTDETIIDGRVTERATYGGINYTVVEYYTEIGEVNYTSTIQDFVNIEFMGYWSNPLIGAKKATINGEDIKNLVLPDDIDLSNSSYTFGGKYIESITLPDNLSTMGKYTFDFESMNDSVFNTDSNGISYLKSNSNDKYMLAKFGDNSGNITIDSNVKMIYGPAWLICKYNKVTINDNVNYFTDIGSDADIKNKYEDGYEVFKGEIEYTGTLDNWFKKEFLRYRNIDFSDRYLQVPSKQGDIWDIHNPVYLASKFSCDGTVLKELNDANNYKDITLNIPEGVEKTNNFSLEGCKFTNIYIPKSIRVIGTKSIGTITGKPIENLGNNETAFPSVYYAGSISDWLNIYFDSFLANPFVDNGDHSAWNNKFYVNNNELVSNLVIPEGVEEIKTAQFAGINSILSISFPSTLKYIDDFAFSRCQNIYNNQGEYGINNIVKKLLESKNGGTEYHYLEDANLDLEKLNEELPNRKFDIVIPKTVNYIGLCAFETYFSGFHIYIPKEVEYLSTYALCIGRDPDYVGACYNPHLYTDRDNAEDSKWGFKQEMDYDGELLKVGLNYYPYNQCNVSMDDIIVDNYNYYKKIDNDTLLPIAVYDVEGIICNIYTEGTDEPIFKSKKDNYSTYYYVALIDGIEIGDKKYNTNIDFKYINFLYSSGNYTHYYFYITRDVTSVDFGEENVSHLEFYFEGTEDEWNNICSNKNLNVTFNCTLVPSNQ